MASPVPNKVDYQKDSRTPCKYGATCYQKNPLHHKKFKHPPAPTPESDDVKDSDEELNSNDSASVSPPPPKKRKIEESPEMPGEKTEENEDSSLSTDDADATEEDEGTEHCLLPPSPVDVRESIKQKFLLEMSDDFYDFWDFCKSLNSDKPQEALNRVGLKLVGAFDVLSGNLKSVDKNKRRLSSYLCHWRFYYDPPEFQTVLVGKENEYRIGYFRDDPSELPVFAASMSSVKNGSISAIGSNLFAAVSTYLTSKIEKCDPFSKTGLQKCLKSLQSFAETKSHSLEKKTAQMKTRDKKIVSKSFHGAGIVVPVNKETDVGYREIPETDSDLKKILKKIVEAKDEMEREKKFEVLQEILTNVQWGTDEGDFGMGLELGVDLFVYGGDEFHSSIYHLLTVAYELLERQSFAEIIKAHLKNRRKGPNMSILDPK